MKKQELENLTVGSIVKTKGAEYTVTALEVEEETVVGFVLDEVKKASLNTMKKNYTLVKLAEVEEAKEDEQVTIEEVIPTVVEDTTEDIKVVEDTEDKMVVVTPIGNIVAEKEEPEVKPVETKKTKKVNKEKAEQKAKIQKFNEDLLEAVNELEGNGILVEQKKGRIAIKFKAIEDSKPRVIIDLVLNSKGAKVHVRRKAMAPIYEELNSKNLTKALPERWALNLEVAIPNSDIFWEVYDKARNFEVDAMVVRRLAKEQKKNNKKENK